MTHDRQTRAMLRAIGSRIRLNRKSQNLSLDAVAQRAGTSKGSLSEIEHALRECRIGIYRRIANALGMDFRDLV